MTRSFRIILLALFLLANEGAGALAAQIDLAILAGPSIPLGDFAAKSSIVEPGQPRSYSALGGGAETGFGLAVELETKITQTAFLGGRVSYARWRADASEIMEKGLVPPGVEEINSVWRVIDFAGFVRVVAPELRTFDFYARVELGVANVKNLFDATYKMPMMGRRTVASSFDLGNCLFLAGGLGVEYKMSQNISLLTEFKLSHLFSDESEATASFGSYRLTGAQKFNIQHLEITAGVRIRLSNS